VTPEQEINSYRLMRQREYGAMLIENATLRTRLHLSPRDVPKQRGQRGRLTCEFCGLPFRSAGNRAMHESRHRWTA
jgi:hypothetical protein